VRSLITTVLDAVGALLLVAAVSFGFAELEVTPLVRGLAVAGAGLLFVSWVTDGAPRPRWLRRGDRK
jgi:hypothetical protein